MVTKKKATKPKRGRPVMRSHRCYQCGRWYMVETCAPGTPRCPTCEADKVGQPPKEACPTTWDDAPTCPLCRHLTPEERRSLSEAQELWDATVHAIAMTSGRDEREE